MFVGVSDERLEIGRVKCASCRVRTGPRQVTRRFVSLTALRWLPAGLVVPVTVLLAALRGLSPTEIGLVFAVHGAVVVCLELPTGGLADALGRRGVLVTGGLLTAAGLLALAAADGLTEFCLAYVLVGVGRALDSGPLEAWYVDTMTALSSRDEVPSGLSRAGAAEAGALAVGALCGGLLPVLASDLLWLPFLVAALLVLAHVLAVVWFVTPGPWSRGRRSAMTALAEGLAAAPRIVAGAVRLAGTDGALRVLLATAFGTGFSLETLELLGPLRFAELVGSEVVSGAAYGLVLAASFTAAAVGSRLAVRATRWARGSASQAMAMASDHCPALKMCPMATRTSLFRR